MASSTISLDPWIQDKSSEQYHQFKFRKDHRHSQFINIVGKDDVTGTEPFGVGRTRGIAIGFARIRGIWVPVSNVPSIEFFGALNKKVNL